MNSHVLPLLDARTSGRLNVVQAVGRQMDEGSEEGL